MFWRKVDDVALNHRKLEDLKYRVVHGKSKEISDVNDALARYETTKLLIKGVLKDVK